MKDKISMDIDKSKSNPSRFIIKFNNIIYRDIDEFIMDMKNIFTQIIQIYNTFKNESKNIIKKEDLSNLFESMIKKIHPLLRDLEEKLSYITDPMLIDESLIGTKRSKLVQLKSLISYTDLSKNIGENINKFTDFFYNRILEEKVALTKKIISHNKNN